MTESHLAPHPLLMKNMIEKRLETVYESIKELTQTFPGTGPHMNELKNFVKQGKLAEAGCYVHRLIEGAIHDNESDPEDRDNYSMNLIGIGLFITAAYFDTWLTKSPHDDLWQSVESAARRAVNVHSIMEKAMNPHDDDDSNK